MTIVNVTTLRERLSHFLELVKDGQEVVVTSHRHKMARILPVSAPTFPLREPVRHVQDLTRIKSIMARGSISAVDVLLDDRNSRAQ